MTAPATPERAVLPSWALVLVVLPAVLSGALAGQIGAVALLGVPAGLVLATVLLRRRGAAWRDLGFRGGEWSRVLALGAGGAIVLFGVNVALEPVVSRFFGAPDLSAFEQVRGNPGALAGMLVLVWTTAAFGEEMLFRGVLLNGLKRYVQAPDHGAWGPALMSSSVIFGFAHIYQGAYGILMTGIIGLGFGIVYLLARRNLWAAILAHGLFDTIGFAALYLGYTG